MSASVVANQMSSLCVSQPAAVGVVTVPQLSANDMALVQMNPALAAMVKAKIDQIERQREQEAQQQLNVQQLERINSSFNFVLPQSFSLDDIPITPAENHRPVSAPTARGIKEVEAAIQSDLGEVRKEMVRIFKAAEHCKRRMVSISNRRFDLMERRLNYRHQKKSKQAAEKERARAARSSALRRLRDAKRLAGACREVRGVLVEEEAEEVSDTEAQAEDAMAVSSEPSDGEEL